MNWDTRKYPREHRVPDGPRVWGTVWRTLALLAAYLLLDWVMYLIDQIGR